MTNCVRCRDCKFWMISSDTKKMLKDHSVNIKPNDDWISEVCIKLRDILDVETSGMWYRSTVDSISTTANFGCVVGEVNEN